MHWTDTVFELIDMRSFSNLWYWIVLAAIWSSASHWALGVPYDMIQRAGRKGAEAEADLAAIVRVNVNRITEIVTQSGVALAAFGAFVLTTLALLGWLYRIEFAQALFLIFLPMSLVVHLSIGAAFRLAADPPKGEALRRVLLWHRRKVQVVGMVSIFVTVFWGMYQNMEIGAIGS